MLVLIPMVGLAIDGSTLFWVKARLSAAVDAAALAAGRNPAGRSPSDCGAIRKCQLSAGLVTQYLHLWSSCRSRRANNRNAPRDRHRFGQCALVFHADFRETKFDSRGSGRFFEARYQCFPGPRPLKLYEHHGA